MAYNNVTNKIKICKKEKKINWRVFVLQAIFFKYFQNTQVNSSFLFHTNHPHSKQKIN